MAIFREIDVVTLEGLCKKDNKIQLLDVRTPEEFNSVHAQDAINLPLDLVMDPSFFKNNTFDNSKDIYIICRSGKRSATACEYFINAGYKNLYNVVGGTLHWIENQLPVTS